MDERKILRRLNEIEDRIRDRDDSLAWWFTPYLVVFIVLITVGINYDVVYIKEKLIDNSKAKPGLVDTGRTEQPGSRAVPDEE